MPRIAFVRLLTCQSPSGAQPTRIRTAQIGNREKREPRRLIGSKSALSGSVALGPISQNPAKAREILEFSPSMEGNPLKPKTKWRCVQSRGDPSLDPKT